MLRSSLHSELRIVSVSLELGLHLARPLQPSIDEHLRELRGIPTQSIRAHISNLNLATRMGTSSYPVLTLVVFGHLHRNGQILHIGFEVATC